MATIALDYDGTYTKDPELWLGFVKHAKANGHCVFLVTMRSMEEVNGETEGWQAFDERLLKIVDRVIATNRKAKANYCANVVHVDVDIWIDDWLQFILRDALA